MKTKTKNHLEPLRRRSTRLRVVAAGLLFATAAVLGANCIAPLRLPWATPTATAGNYSQAAEVDPATNTVYVINLGDNTISVIDGHRCNGRNGSHCAPVATMSNVGFGPLWPVLDRSSHTLYVTNALTEGGDNNNMVAVLDVSHCNAQDTSGCNQAPVALVTVAGLVGNQDTGALAAIALDSSTHTLYVGDADDGPISMIDTATCNALQTSGCSQGPVTAVNGDGMSIDSANHSVYVNDAVEGKVWVLNGLTCNGTTQSDCTGTSVASLPADSVPFLPGVDLTSHSIYVPLAGFDVPSQVAVVDVSSCTGANRSGCGQTPFLFPADSVAEQVLVDQTARTAYVLSELSNSLTAINTATCNGTNHSGCPTRPHARAMAVGVNPIMVALNPVNHTIYEPSQDTNTVWALDGSRCNGTKNSGCTDFAPTTTVGDGPVQVELNPITKTLYETNQLSNTVSVIDTTACNQRNLSGCNRTWPAIPVGSTARHIGINKTTNTIYVSNLDDGTLSVINGATCNRNTTTGCSQTPPTTTVGNAPQQIAVDEMTNTIYNVNQADGTVSIVDGTHCNGTDTSGCAQSWPVASVGQSPQALTFNPNNRTLYVTNTNDDTVSVINGNTCNRLSTSGCTPVATVPVGARPRAVGVLFDRNTVFVANRVDLTVSIFDGATCNGTNTSGCPQTPPQAVLVGAFPETGGNGNNLNGRSIAIDQHKHLVFIPTIGDSDLVVLNGNVCRPGHMNDCRAKVANKRAGGFSVTAAVDEASDTVYVANDTESSVSIFRSEYPDGWDW
jgi:DNA-binding beta-propeller fold protein YncE